MRVAPFHPDHLSALHLPEEQVYLERLIADPAYRRSFFHPGMGWTVVDGSDPVACYGVTPLYPGRGWIWAFFDRDIGPRRFLGATYRARRALDYVLELGFYRLEATIKADYDKGRRWVAAMGLEYEGYNRLLDGLYDYELYARVKT